MTCFATTFEIPLWAERAIRCGVHPGPGASGFVDTGFAEAEGSKNERGTVDDRDTASRTFIGPCRNVDLLINWMFGFSYAATGDMDTCYARHCGFAYSFRSPKTTCDEVPLPAFECYNAGQMVPTSYSITSPDVPGPFRFPQNCPGYDVNNPSPSDGSECECVLRIEYQSKLKDWPFVPVGFANCGIVLPSCAYMQVDREVEIEAIPLDRQQARICEIGCDASLPEDYHPAIYVPTVRYRVKFFNLTKPDFLYLEQQNGTLNPGCFFENPPESTLFQLGDITPFRHLYNTHPPNAGGGLMDYYYNVEAEFIIKRTTGPDCGPSCEDCTNPTSLEAGINSGRWNKTWLPTTTPVSGCPESTDTHWHRICDDEGGAIFPTGNWSLTAPLNPPIGFTGIRNLLQPSVGDCERVPDPEEP